MTITKAKPPPLGHLRPTHTTLTRATAESILTAIHTGAFPNGSQLPAETELINILGVSRTTLREALKSLEELGVIIRRRGLGTFVAERSIIKDLNTNFGISDMIRQAGMQPGNRDVSIRAEPATASIATALEIDDGEPVIVVERVRTADNLPAVYSLDHFWAGRIDRATVERYVAQEDSLYTFLLHHYQIRIVRGGSRLVPVVANTQIAARLNVNRGAPLLCIMQTDYSSDNQPMLHSIEYHLPDLFVFTVTRKGPSL